MSTVWKENRASRTVCVSCGHQLQYDISTGSEGSNPQSHAIEGNRCGNYGRYVPGGARFCTACGQPADGNTVCPECHSRIGPMDRYCPGCGRALRPEKAPRFTSRPVAAMMLGLVPGLLSLWGVGHLFAGRLERGIAFLVMGLVMNYVAPLSLIPLFQYVWDAPNTWWGLAFLSVLGAVAWIVLWLFQSIDAYRVAGGD